MSITHFILFTVFGLAHAGEQPVAKLDLHVVPTPIKSYRLLAMSMDDDGFIWAGAIHKVVHRYDPRTGKVEDFLIPFPVTASACICVGKKVYILGQAYPKLIIYDRTAKKFSEIAYPSSKPNVWYGTEVIDGRHIFLFDRGGAGVIKWDTQTDSGKAIPWPYKAPFPGGGSYEATDNAIWCKVWQAGGQYGPLGIARLDLEKNEFTGFHPFPTDDDGLKPFTDPAKTLFLPYTLKGKVVPFDFKEKRWCKFLDVPQYGKLFGFMGGPVSHKGRYYFSLSTYNGTDVGCDGKPYHFCNAMLEFDPQTRRFEFPTLMAKDAYHQIAYMLSAKGEFFATGSNILEKDGKFNRDRAGEVVFWQTVVQGPSEPITPIPPANTEWHKQLLARAMKGNIDVVFFGDSSTAGWTKTGMDVWKQRLEPLNAANFGVNGDGIGHLLWRLQNGEIEGYKPKVAVIWIGHVNIFLGKQNAGEIAEGIMACVREIHKKQPDSKILLMAPFYTYSQWSDKQRATAIAVNKLLVKQADGKKVRLLDVNERFAARKDELLKELAEVKDPHNVTLIYKIWGEALEKPLKELLNQKPMRTLNSFKTNLDGTLTPAKAVAAFGEPDRKLGSGLIIYEYELEDGTKMRLGFPGFAPIQYAHHVQKNGKFVVISVK